MNTTLTPIAAACANLEPRYQHLAPLAEQATTNLLADVTLRYEEDAYGHYMVRDAGLTLDAVHINGGIDGYGPYMAVYLNNNCGHVTVRAHRAESAYLAACYLASLQPYAGLLVLGIADSGTVAAKEGDLVTVYSQSELFGNIQQLEGKLVRHGRRPYAQYPNAPFVELVPKGKRKRLCKQGSYQPYLLVLKGHDHPTPDSLFAEANLSTDPNLEVKQGRYGSFDVRWSKDFDACINAYLRQHQGLVVADYREHQGSYQAPR